MRSLHPDKTGLRGLTIAESFGQNDNRSVLAGVVMRSDLVIDGIVFGCATLAGDDATDAILDMYARLGRSDINYVLLSGMVLSLYNIVDIARLYDSLKIPIIGLSYRDSPGIEDSIRRRFAGSFESKITAIPKTGRQDKGEAKDCARCLYPDGRMYCSRRCTRTRHLDAARISPGTCTGVGNGCKGA